VARPGGWLWHFRAEPRCDVFPALGRRTPDRRDSAYRAVWVCVYFVYCSINVVHVASTCASPMNAGMCATLAVGLTAGNLCEWDNETWCLYAGHGYLSCLAGAIIPTILRSISVFRRRPHVIDTINLRMKLTLQMNGSTLHASEADRLSERSDRLRIMEVCTQYWRGAVGPRASGGAGGGGRVSSSNELFIVVTGAEVFPQITPRACSGMVINTSTADGFKLARRAA